MNSPKNAAQLKNSALFRWKLRHASGVNPINALIKTDSTKGNPSEDWASIFTALIALIAAAAGILSFYYVSKKLQSIRETGNNGVLSLNTSALATLDTHHVCIPVNNGSLQLTLPSSSSLDLGRFVSASVPLSLHGDDSPSDTRTATVVWTNKSYTIRANKGALFMVAHELGSKKWKLIREWPTDNGYMAGT